MIGRFTMKENGMTVWKRSVCATLLLTLVGAFGSLLHAAEYHAVVVQANMQVLNARMPDRSYRFLGSNEPGHLFLLQQPIAIKLAIAKEKDSGEVRQFAVEIQGIGTRTPGRVIDAVPSYLGASNREPLIELVGEAVAHPITVTFGGQPEAQVEVQNLQVPQRYGTFALILTRPGFRQFLGTVARVPDPAPGGDVENTPLFGDGQFFNRPEWYEARAQVYARLGIHGFRGEANWSESDNGEYDLSRYDKLYGAMAAHGIKELVCLGGHSRNRLPFGEPTPAADYTGSPYGGHADWLVDPTLYPKFGDFVTTFCQRYWKGGKGGIYALENYNEPWEGGGISGWARDCLQYRVIQKTIAQAAWKVDRKIPLAAASSIMNTEDKFYSAGDREMDQYIDIFTDHYVSPPMCYGPMVAKAHGKISMESETWMGDAEYKLPQLAAQFMASGQLHIAPWQPAEVFDTVPGQDDPYFIPGPVATATAAFNHFATGKPFEKMAFLSHLPWVFQFGKDDDADAVLVVFGQLSPLGVNDPKARLWSQVDEAKGGTLTIDNHDGLLQFFDLAGNPVYLNQATITLPMTVVPTYLKCSQGPGAAVQRLASARIQGKPPVEIIPHDLASAVDAPAARLVVDVHNCLNSPISGKLSVTAPSGIAFKANDQAVQLSAGETKSMLFEIASAKPDQANAYPLAYRFSSEAGNAEYRQTMNVTAVLKRTINVDGNLQDWQGVPGVLVASRQQALDIGELARRPWTDMKEQKPEASFGEVKMAWDDQNIYLAARVHHAAAQKDKLRLERRIDDSYFHSAADDVLPYYQEFLAKHPGHSFSEVPYVYARPPEPALACRGDRVQFAFDTTPGFHDMVADDDRVPYGFHAVPDSDYEYSAYLCADGKGEVWRLLAPGVPRVHDFPRQPRGSRSTGVVAGAKLVVRDDDDIRTYEMAIPKSELKDLHLQSGSSFAFTFRLGFAKGGNIDFGADKAATKINGLTLHPYWEPKPSCRVRWTLTD